MKSSRRFLQDEKAQAEGNTVISGVIMLGIVGIIFAVMLLIYANVQPELVAGSCTTPIIAESITGVANGSDMTPGHTMCASPYLTMWNATITYTDGNEISVFPANNTIHNNCATGGVTNYAECVEAAHTYSVSYTAEGLGVTSAEKVASNMYKGYDLASIAPLIMGATLVISIVLGMLGAFAYSRRD